MNAGDMLPVDLRAFLSGDRALQFNSSNCEIGGFTFRRIEDIQEIEVAIRASVDDWLEHDPHNGDGYYLVQAIDLIASCDGYDPELLQEAASLRRTNPRGAFVLAFIAAEVGLKECIADLIPDAEWLVFNMPTPSLSRILDDLLTNLPSKCAYSDELVPPKLFETIKKAEHMRNEIVHRGNHPKVIEKLSEVLFAVRNLLWLLDYLRGCPWVIRYIGETTL